jgi:predicted amino acid racemase
MFLSRLLDRNPRLAQAAVALHQGGELKANTYLLDTDAFETNARAIAEAAARHGLTVYAMTKQFGRNPDACGAIAAAGIDRAVAVDLQCMEAVARGPLRVAHVGHLVQPHRGTEDAVVAARPEVVTVFNVEIAARIAAAARRAGLVQPVLMRVVAPGDRFYFGHGGGFDLDDLEASARQLEGLEGIRVVGVTSFPCLLADPARREVTPTPNFATLARAAERLRAAGFGIEQVNAPGTTSAGTMATLAAGGATHVEPGNAFHGTTPLHVFDPAAPEIPAIVYVSEVSHLHDGRAYVFAAGYYVDKVLGDYQLSALVGRDERILDQRLPVEVAPDGAIHYYATVLLPRHHDVRAGDTVVFCYRPQVFVTRARTRAVAGLASNRPSLGATYDVEARPVEGVS